jgi:hypothetical protein
VAELCGTQPVNVSRGPKNHSLKFRVFPIVGDDAQGKTDAITPPLRFLCLHPKTPFRLRMYTFTPTSVERERNDQPYTHRKHKN